MSQLVHWDFTSYNDKISQDLIATTLKQVAKKWTFQQEKCPTTGRLHWQGRVALYKRKRENEFVNMLHETPLRGMHVSPTSTEGSKSFNYCGKLDTRVNGPWTDQDPIPEPMPMQLRMIDKPLPWQKQILDSFIAQLDIRTADMRGVNILFSKEGNIGGSIIKDWIRYYKLGVVVPSFLDAQDMSAMIMAVPPSHGYFIDMPRNMPRSNLAGFWTGIESLKDGYCYDKRYKFRDRLMSRPCIWIKTNEMPDLNLLSKDRWIIWEVDGAVLVCKSRNPAPRPIFCENRGDPTVFETSQTRPPGHENEIPTN